MKRILIALASFCLASAAMAVPYSATAVFSVVDSTGTNYPFLVEADGTVKSDGVMTPGGLTLVTTANGTYTATVAKAASAIQPTTAAYTAAVAKATSALQPNAVAATNVIVSGDAKTNTIIVIGGQITSWVVTE